MTKEVRPDLLDQLGLVPALETLTDELNKRGINIRIETTGTQQRLSAEIEANLFRISQEVLNNIRKHFQATEALVKVEFISDKVRLSIIDNGKGFKVPKVTGDFANKGNLGLIGMQERSRLLNGNFSVESRVGKGTSILVEIKR